MVDRGWIPAEGNDNPDSWRRYDEPGTVKVKGITCAMDLKMIAANVEKVAGVRSCEPGNAGATTSFVIMYDPALVTEKDIYLAIENTGSCEAPDERPYKVKE